MFLNLYGYVGVFNKANELYMYFVLLVSKIVYIYMYLGEWLELLTSTLLLLLLLLLLFE